MSFIINPYVYAAGVPSGLVLDLDANVGVFSDAGSTPATNGGTVQQWNDQSGGSHNFSQATSGSRPVYSTGIVNSLPVLDTYVSSVARNMSIAHHVDLDFPNDSTVFVVLKANSFFGGANGILYKGATGGGVAAAYYLYLDGSGKPTVDRPWVEAGVASTNSVGTSAFRLITAHISGTTVSHYLDGAANGTDTLGAGTGTTQPMIFAPGIAGSGLDARVARIKAWNVALGTSDRQSVEDSLGATYGITITH